LSDHSLVTLLRFQTHTTGVPRRIVQACVVATSEALLALPANKFGLPAIYLMQKPDE